MPASSDSVAALGVLVFSGWFGGKLSFLGEDHFSPLLFLIRVRVSVLLFAYVNNVHAIFFVFRIIALRCDSGARLAEFTSKRIQLRKNINMHSSTHKQPCVPQFLLKSSIRRRRVSVRVLHLVMASCSI